MGREGCGGWHEEKEGGGVPAVIAKIMFAILFWLNGAVDDSAIVYQGQKEGRFFTPKDRKELLFLDKMLGIHRRFITITLAEGFEVGMDESGNFIWRKR